MDIVVQVEMRLTPLRNGATQDEVLKELADQLTELEVRVQVGDHDEEVYIVAEDSISVRPL